jgi:hypothetical protein
VSHADLARPISKGIWRLTAFTTNYLTTRYGLVPPLNVVARQLAQTTGQLSTSKLGKLTFLRYWIQTAVDQTKTFGRVPRNGCCREKLPFGIDGHFRHGCAHVGPPPKLSDVPKVDIAKLAHSVTH